MNPLDPQQELFTFLKTSIESKGYDVYDSGLPPDGTPYPFVYLGVSRQTDTENKTAVFGTVYQIIHVWNNNPKRRGTVSAMLLDIKKICRSLSDTENFSWFVRNVNQQIIEDTTTKTPLLHGVLEVEFKFS